MRLLPYDEGQYKRWDETIESCPNATFLHTRRFLSYHNDRFRDMSLVLEDEKQTAIGLFPAAVDPADPKHVISHPGITFGGVLHSGRLLGQSMVEALELIRQYYQEQGFTHLTYKAVPYIYHQSPASDDLYALFRTGAVRSRCDLSCAITLSKRRETSSRRKRGLKKAQSRGVEVSCGAEFVDAFWRLIRDNLNRKLGIEPVHSQEEIMHLYSLFPGNIRFVVGLLNGIVVAGVTLFCTSSVMHAQYIASNAEGNEVCALDAVFEHCIQAAQSERMRYFDFGTSNTNEGQQLTSSLYQFKSEFGGGGVAHEFYDLPLKA